MKNSTAILATIALGAALAVGSATASMARGGMGGHGGHGGHEGSGNPSFMTNGSGFDGGRDASGNHGFSHGRHFNNDANAFFGFGPFCSYGPASGQYTGRYERHYCS